MALRPFITDEEKAKIVTKHEAGWTKKRICERFRRTHTTVTAAIKEAEKAERKRKREAKKTGNQSKIAAVNEALATLPAPSNDVVEKTVTTLCAALRKNVSDLKALNIDLEAGECEAEFTTTHRFKIGA